MSLPLKSFVVRIDHWDQQLITSLYGWSGKQMFDRVFYYISRSADGHLYGLIGGVLLAIHGVAEMRMFFGALIAFVIELSLYEVLKHGIKRPRPFEESPHIRFLIPPPDQFSFPSGHTAAAFLMAVILTSGIPVLAPGLFIWAAMVGFSRIYLGVHYPTDVLMGSLLGSSTGMIGLIMIEILI